MSHIVMCLSQVQVPYHLIALWADCFDSKYVLINCRLHADDKLYETPAYFASDWLNEYCKDNSIDDYRFVYMGPKNSW